MNVIPIVIGALGSYSKNVKTWMEKLKIPNIIDSAQLSAILETAHVLRKVLNLQAAGSSQDAARTDQSSFHEWQKIWENEKHHNEIADWIKKEEAKHTLQEEQEWKDIEKDEVTNALKKASNWKSPGIDKVPNFWLKNLDELHDTIACLMTDIIKHPEKCPHWLTEGLTYLLPKTNDTRNPKNYRPITCLPQCINS